MAASAILKLMQFTAGKVSQYGVNSGPYLDTFHAVVSIKERMAQTNFVK